MDLGQQVLLDVLLVVQRRLGRLLAVGRRRAGPVEQIAVHVEHRHRFRRQALDRARHQVADRQHVGRRQPRSRFQPHQNAGFGRLLGLQEYRVLGKSQVDARALDLGQRHDRTLEFAFQGAAEIDVLGEVGDAEVGLVEELEAGAAALGQTGRRHLDPQLGHAFGGRQHRGPVLRQAELGSALAQLLNHRARVFGCQVGVERPEVLFAPPAREGDQSAGHRHRYGYDQDALPQAQIRDEGCELAHSSPATPRSASA